MDNVTRLLMQGAAGAAGGGTYVDDVFSTFLYAGNESNRSINNGIDLSGEGGMTWIKERTNNNWHQLFDTERGAGKRLASNVNNAESTDTTTLSAFNNNGFSIGTNDIINDIGDDYASWSFRKQKGFFDVVTWTGNGSTRTIPHNLGSVPGCIMVKNTSSTIDWTVWHRGDVKLNATNTLSLNSSGATATNNTYFDNGSTPPTTTNFTVHTSNRVNANGETYVAYIFASEDTSTAATARSVYYPAANTGIRPNISSDFVINTTLTLEGYFNYDTLDGHQMFFDARYSSSTETSFIMYKHSSGDIRVENGPDGYGGTLVIQSTTKLTEVNKWYHIALTMDGSTCRLFIDGKLEGTATIGSFGGTGYLGIGNAYQQSAAYCVRGYISNVRLTRGQALYTSDFTPSTEPLTTTSQGAIASNVKLLCCNNSSVTGATVIPTGSLSTYGDPSASTDDPFDDPNGFKFGEGNDQNVIKCGTFIPDSNGKATVNLGWEPQWWMWKKTSGAGGWGVYDAMRGVNAIGNDQYLEMHNPNAENSVDVLNFTSTGVDISLSAASHAGSTFLYVAVRRPDGYVGKPPTAGTDVFTIDQGNGSSTEAFTSGFPVDYAIWRQTNTTFDWYNSARKLANANDSEYVKLNSTDGSTTTSFAAFANNTGFHNYSSYGSNSHGWMWKRHAGMDVVIYTGNGNNTDGANAHAHGLGKPPEMIWIKTLNDGSYSGVTHWTMSHEGLNSGINPWQYTMSINNTWSETTTSNFGNTTPTSTHFYVGDPGNGRSNDNNSNYMAILFASVDGICKVGTYNGSSSTQTIQCGFQPRFFWQKRVTGTGEWHTCDTIRGWGSGNDQFLYFNATAGPGGYDFGAPTSTGFTITGGAATVSNTGEKYIFYAHA